MKFFLEYEEDSFMTRPPDDDGWDRGDYTDTVDFKALYLSNDNFGWSEELEYDLDGVSAGDKLFLVVVRYGTGDTFGTTSGRWCPVGLFKTDAEAEELLRRLRRDPKDHPGSSTWTGYFECMEDIEVHELEVFSMKA